jgi:hypothetical protein
MTTPNTTSYRTALKDILSRGEGIRQNIYIDSSGYLTTGMGLLLINSSNTAQVAAFTSTRAVVGAGTYRLGLGYGADRARERCHGGEHRRGAV